jgi:membrane associated rhomboid family serine protease
MFKSVWNDVINYFKTGNVIARIILINIAIFVGVNIMSVFMTGGGLGPSFPDFLKFFSASADLRYLAFHPWGVFTCIFLHSDFMHILFNMIWLYSMGRIAGDLLGDRRMLSLYVLGGIFGALTFVLLSQFVGISSYALGASGSVLAITVAAGVVAPEYRISLIFFETKLKFIVVAFLFLNIIGAFSMSNGGGTDYFGHLGGAFFGWLYVFLLGRGTDLSIPFNRFKDRIVSIFQSRPQPKRPQPKVAFKNKEKIKQNNRQQPGRKSDYGTVQERIDDILDKINRNGMKSLSPEEKAFLNDYNKL